MFTIQNKRNQFWQWDTGQRLIVNADVCSEVHFYNGTSDCSLVCEVYEEDGIRLVNVPNILLQESKAIRVYAYVCEENDHHTQREMIFPVFPRSKPEDYVYTETEIKRYSDLEEDIAELGDYVHEHESLGITGATVGQTVKITEVDENGKPTKWECVDETQPDWNQNDEISPDYVNNRTHYDSRTEWSYTFDGNIEGKETVGDGFLVKISDNPISANDIIGATVTVSTGLSVVIPEDDIIMYTDTLYAFSDGLVKVALEDTEFEGILLHKGVFAYCDKSSGFYISEIGKFTSGELKTLDEKYLPDSLNERVKTAQSTAEAAQATAESAQATADNAIGIATNDMDICKDSDGNWYVKNGSYADLVKKINANIPVKININSTTATTSSQYIPMYIYNNVEDETIDMNMLHCDSMGLYFVIGYLKKNNVFRIYDIEKLALEKGV